MFFTLKGTIFSFDVDKLYVIIIRWAVTTPRNRNEQGALL